MVAVACYLVFYATYSFLHLDQIEFWFSGIKLSILTF